MKSEDEVKDILTPEDSDDESLSLKDPIISYGADYTLDTIRQYIRGEQIKVQPSFQRKFVWDMKKGSKLIESFLLGYPVPNILLGRPQDTELMEVIDGQQRLLTIDYFFSGNFKNESVFKLVGDDIDPQFRNKTFNDLGDVLQRKLKNAVLKSVVLVYPPKDSNLKFTVFQRINTGSVVLNQQEIRNCIFGGPFNEMLIDLNNSDKTWRAQYSKNPDKRMRDMETILRFFAGYSSWKSYDKPMTGFLNKFMEDHQNDSKEDLDKLKELFSKTIRTVAENISHPFAPTGKARVMNRAMFESVMVSVARLEEEGKLDKASLGKKHKELLSDKEYIENVTIYTSDKKRYLSRMETAYKTLS